ncbi:Crp/Fnr family transcriptional regulator [Marinilabilia rubra]|uniref:Crp/Fnr family transcriptional regulator n=1 Tax=Marinilabilia rubra TaxID=2162893 RepID=A0A2U2B5E7_9BACT|nr:Crp/Fnr family transcriptional regulator [Marinilabilia rubra]PWD98262.1 Crp/Fnr family transcriptional regulator [Marinilabilia rubra]
MNPLKKFIEKYTFLPQKDWELIKSSFNRKEIVKDEIIIEEGKTCRHFYFLENGLVRFFKYHDGDELTFYFVNAPYCFSDKESLEKRIPAKVNIQALSRCIVWQTTAEQIRELSKMDSWEQFTKNLILEISGYIEQIMITNRIQSAESRYLKLLKIQPELEEKVPLKHLANFLGIAPQSLSRIRSKNKKNNQN